ncbi:hypothetical protein HD806DRAFT_529482 [Xylariaceae sp. AK1471]|nr:hypothetical protein HD806DRAFT_529482 [Xylariaceae sp. AK1471]
MKTTKAGLVAIMATIVGASPLLNTTTTDIIEPTVNINALLPPPASTATGVVEVQGVEAETDFAVLGKACNVEKCKACIKSCGGLSHFSCYYFQCMNSACKECDVLELPPGE